MKIEMRKGDDRVELRADEGAGLAKIHGYASVFHQWTTLYEDERMIVREVIRPTAFNNAIREGQDVRALFNHNPSLILGRTKSKTLWLSVDAKGLAYTIITPPTTTGRNTLTSIRRGDVSQSSFGFVVRKGGEKLTSKTEDGKGRRLVERELTDLDLIDVSPVTYPAYGGTSASSRSGLADGTEDVAKRLVAWGRNADMEARLNSPTALRLWGASSRPQRSEAKHETSRGAKRRR